MATNRVFGYPRRLETSVYVEQQEDEAGCVRLEEMRVQGLETRKRSICLDYFSMSILHGYPYLAGSSCGNLVLQIRVPFWIPNIVRHPLAKRP